LKRKKGKLSAGNKRRLIKAIEKGEGNITKIAQRLGLKYKKAWDLCNMDDPDIVCAMEHEVEKLHDIADKGLRECVKQSINFSVKKDAATWIKKHIKSKSSRKKKYVPEKSTIQLEGGETPIEINNNSAISLEQLKILFPDIGDRKKILEKLEEMKKEEKEKDE